ncbi:MAG: formylglycine-generating enzyme family protein [Lentisphaeraceae bacterium]|nr:formylglycine-generating enzyme family protein [Lentisphaeraceae bacterium]
MNGEDKSKDPEKEVQKVASSEKSEKKPKAKSPKKTSDTKPEKMTAGIDPKLAAKFKEKSAELKERIHKEQLEDRIRHHTISPMKAIVPGIAGILLVITCIIFFSSKADKMMGGVNPATAPRIKAEGEKAAIPENAELPNALSAVENSYFTDTPDDPLLKGGKDAVEEQKQTVYKFKLPVEVKNEIGMHFRLIPPGKFIMGSPEDQEFREEDEFQHLSNIKVPFYIGKTEVTVQQWLDVLGHLPSNSLKEPNYPVTGVSLNDSLVFVQELNRKLPEDAGFKYFIISEDEWEYACRAGTEAPYFYGHYLLSNDYTVFKSSTTTHNVEPVAQRLPNPWGLYDMLGNAMEWTRTPYFIYACGENQYAGIDAKTAESTGHDLKEYSWDTPIYDGEHPENLVDMFDKFDVPMRAFGTNIDICYWDINNNKQYDNHEPIWKDSLAAGKVGVYDPGVDVLVLTFAKEIPEGTKGEKEGLYYYDKDLSTEWNPGEGFWARDDTDRKFNNNYSMRGGAYFVGEEDLRSASRFNSPKQNAPSYAGVRVVIYLDKFVKK